MEQALHDTATLPGNFNPHNGRWESVKDTSTKHRTRLVFDPEANKLLAVDEATESARRADKFLGVDMAAAGYFNNVLRVVWPALNEARHHQ